MNLIATKTRTIGMLNEDIIQVVYFDDVVIDVSDMKEDFEEYDKFTSGKKLKRLIIGGRYTEITNEALKYSREENIKRKDSILVEAVVVQSLAQRLMANFYYKLLKPNHPIKVFNDVEKAKEWLVSIDVGIELTQ